MHDILFISYDGLTDQLGQSQILPYIIGLSNGAYRFTIMSCEKPERYQARKAVIEEIVRSNGIRWVPLVYHKSPPVLSSVYDYRNMLRTAISLHKETPFSLVHTRPGLPTLVALQLKKRYGVKFLNDVRGFWADERVDGQLWNLGNPLYKTVYRFFKNKEAECLRVNDYTTCLTHSAKREIGKWNLLADKEKVEVIPCSVDLSLFDPERITSEQKDALRMQLGIRSDEFVVSYLGSTGTWYMMDDMFRFFRLLCSRIKHAKFLLMCPAAEHPRVQEYLQKHGIDPDRVVVREVSRPDVPLHLSLSHYSVFFIKPCFSKLSSSPTKHGEIMAMGIPVITNSGVGDVQEIVESTDSGFVIHHFSDEEFASVLDKMFTATFRPEAIRSAAGKFYSLRNAVQQYQRVYQSVLG